MIRFGSWSTTLGLAAGFGALISVMLLVRAGNRAANRLLAGLLFTALLRLMPYVLGFAGFYDAYPWLSFAPFDLALAIGPLLYLYIRRLSATALPSGWLWHFLPAAVDLIYRLWAFSLPLAAKRAWDHQIHERWIDPLESWGGLFSLALYLLLAWRHARRYQDWLADHVSDRDEHRQSWIFTVLTALALWLAANAAFDLIDALITPLSYYDRFPQYLIFAAIILGLGLEGWRQAGHRYPAMVPLGPAPPPLSRDWPALGAAWADRLRTEAWWQEPGLSLGEVARRLGTNETYLSRALNEGLGRNFNSVVNGLRIEAVQARLPATERDLLTLALECGFSSKASFNRVFREVTGVSPTAWRKSQILKGATYPDSEAPGSAL